MALQTAMIAPVPRSVDLVACAAVLLLAWLPAGCSRPGSEAKPVATASAPAGARPAAARDPVAGKPAGANSALLAYQTGLSLLLKGDPEKARSEFERATQLDPKMSEGHYELGKLLVHLSSQNVGSQSRDHDVLDRGLAALSRALELEPKNDDHAYWLGRGYHLKKDNRKALEFLEQAVELNPKNALAWKRLGLVQFDDEKVELARDSFRKAIEVDPADAGSYFQLGLALESLEDLAGARAAFERSIEIDRTQPEPYYKLSQLLARADDPEGALRAEADFQRWSKFDGDLKRRMKAVNQNPGDAQALLAVGEMYFAAAQATGQQGTWKEALEWFLKSINIDPKDPHAHLYGGIVRRELKEYEAALNHLKEAEFLAPDSLEPKLQLVRLYAQTQDAAALEELVQKVEAEAALDGEALQELGLVCQEVGRTGEAERLLEKARALRAAAKVEGGEER